MSENALAQGKGFNRGMIFGQAAPREWNEVRAWVRRGVPVESFDNLCDYLEAEPSRLIVQLGGALRSLQRRRKAHQPLGPEVSDQLARFVRVLEHVGEVFESREETLSWLKTANPALGGERPLDVLDTDAGATQVDQILTRIEHGIYS